MPSVGPELLPLGEAALVDQAALRGTGAVRPVLLEQCGEIAHGAGGRGPTPRRSSAPGSGARSLAAPARPAAVPHLHQRSRRAQRPVARSPTRARRRPDPAAGVPHTAASSGSTMPAGRSHPRSGGADDGSPPPAGPPRRPGLAGATSRRQPTGSITKMFCSAMNRFGKMNPWGGPARSRATARSARPFRPGGSRCCRFNPW